MIHPSTFLLGMSITFSASQSPCSVLKILNMFEKKSAANKANCGLWVVKEPDFQGHHSLHAKVNLLDQLPCGPIVDIQVCPIVAPFHMFHVESLEEAPWVTPLCRDHHIVVGLVPEIIPEFSLVLLILDPEAFWLESFPIKENEVALPVLLRPVAQGGDHDVAIRETVGGVGGAHTTH